MNQQGGRYGSALQAASASGGESVGRMLLSRGVDVNPKGGQFGTSLRLAYERGCEGIVQLLLEHGPEEVDAKGRHYRDESDSSSTETEESTG